MTIAGWLIFIPIVAAPLVYIVGRLEHNHRPDHQVLTAQYLAMAALAVTWLVFVILTQVTTPADLVLGTGLNMRIDGLSLLLTALILMLGTLVVFFSGPYISGSVGEEKYYALLLMLIGAMIGLVCAADLFNLWVWFEAMAVSSYLLVMFYRDQADALEAGMKYFVQNALGSALVLFGIALVLAQTGTLDLKALAVTTQMPLMIGAVALFVVGFGVKIALVPLHTWLPDAHAQAPSGISAMLSGVVIEVGLIALLRVLVAVAGISPSWGELLMAFGAANMLIGNLMALQQTQVKRLLAYSSVSQVGYMLLGIGIGVYAHQTGGVQGGLFHLLTHGLMKGLAFLAAGSLLYVLSSAQHSAGNHQPLLISDITGAAQRYPLTALGLSIAVLGLGGLPPFAGFMSKWQIFAAGFATHNGWIEALIVFAGLNTILSLGYYVPLVARLYRQHPSNAVQGGQALPVMMRVPLVILSIAVFVIGVWPGIAEWLTGPAAKAVLGAFGG